MGPLRRARRRFLGLLRALGTSANAAAVKAAVEAMEDVEVDQLEQPGRGAKPIMYRLLPPNAQNEDKPVKESAVKPAPTPTRATAPKKPKLQVVRTGPTRKLKSEQAQAVSVEATANPFVELL